MKLRELIVYIVAYVLITIVLLAMLVVNYINGVDFETYLLLVSVIISFIVLILLLSSVKRSKKSNTDVDRPLDTNIINDYNVIFVANCLVNKQNCMLSLYANKEDKSIMLIRILTVDKNPSVIAEFNIDEIDDIYTDGENDIEDIILINNGVKYKISNLSPLKKQRLINLVK